MLVLLPLLRQSAPPGTVRMPVPMPVAMMMMVAVAVVMRVAMPGFTAGVRGGSHGREGCG
ncbi:hypothetical protein LILAB_24680 [Corallococcus macrosporus]|uniref:Uncharacterized protein n=1 Tax=Myxococcus fulvus (strain ATCC BAA-855 / HW-1) TaxID=483219 RepID=F8CRT3_MYXFH|nr:hypothetical protein LILAB_24680 [Corallococcus macrosporus]